MKNFNHKILVVDDDFRILQLLVKLLQKEGFEAEGAKDTVEAKEKLKEAAVLVIDCMMPGQSGIEFVKELREQGNEIPAIMLTALDSIDNKVQSFESGLDDYLTKPFEEREFIARLRRILCKQQKQEQVIVFGDCSYDKRSGVLTRKGEKVALTSTEQALLDELLLTPNQPVSRLTLATKLGTTVSERTIDVQIVRLRRKLGDDSNGQEVIKTVRHKGYKIDLN